MTNSMSVFAFNSNEVRTFADANGEPWFCAKDVCKVLGYANDTQAIQKNCKERGVSKRYLGVVTGKKANGEDSIQQIEMSFINEGNLYRLIVKSRKPEAEAFETLVMEEILPTIRKTGSYSAPERKTKQVLIGGLTGDQQDAIKALVKARAEETDDKKLQSLNTRKIWSAVKAKFKDTVTGDYTYKAIAPEHYSSIVSLIARLPLEGEFIAASETQKLIEPSIPEGKMLVDKQSYQDMERMITLHRERLTLLDKANSEMQHAYNLAKVVIEGHMNNAMQAVRTANTYLYDPIREAHTALRMSVR